MSKKYLTNENEEFIIEEESGITALVHFPCGDLLQIYVPEGREDFSSTNYRDEEVAVFTIPFERCSYCEICTGDECVAKVQEWGGAYYRYASGGRAFYVFDEPLEDSEILDYFSKLEEGRGNE